MSRWPGIAIFCFGLLLSLTGPSSARADDGWRVLLDENGSLRLDDIRSSLPRMLPATPAVMRTHGGRSVLWLHQRLPAHVDESMLRVASPYLSYLDFYLLDGDTLLSHVRTGNRLPFSTRPLPSRDFLLPVPASQVPTDLYLRLASEYPLPPGIELASTRNLAVNDGPALLVGGLLGGLVMLLVQNLIRLAYWRRRANLWLAVTQASLLLSALGMLGVFGAWMGDWQPVVPLLVHEGILVAALGMLATTLHFFQPLQPSRRLRGLLLGEILLIVPVALALLVSDLQSSVLVLSLVAVVTLSCLLMGYAEWRRGYAPARLFVAAMAVPTLVALLLLPALLGYFELPADWLVHVLLATVIVSGVLLAVALNERRHMALMETFSNARAQAETSAERKAKADFLAKMGHEIRTPMNGVLGMTELLLGTPLSAKQRDYVQTIHSAGNELLALINEILDVSRLESGQIELDDVPFDLNALVEECLDIYRAKAEEQRLELISFMQPQVPRVIGGDPARLRQALLSLLENAFRQTEEGEILLVVALDTSGAAPRLRFAVQDSGRPLEAGERDALLHAELQSQDLLASQRGGRRLDLIITRQLIRLMGGEFGIQGGGNQGNTLWLTLPLEGRSLEQPVADLEGPLQDARLLVVDDNDTCRKVLQQQCGAWGMTVSAVASGKEALALLRTRAHLGDTFDVVLLDQDMPGMSGLQLAAKIKEDPSLNHDILIIMLTGISHAPSKINARNAGIKRVLAKPVAGYTLRTTLAEELGQRHAGTEPQDAPEVPDGFRVLVAEDDGISTKVIRGMLGKLNLQPDTATNGQEALDALKRRRYDLVLMDCEMPVLDGFSATLELREWERRERRPRTPVVALTAHILTEHKERARQAGMDGHMAKPVELSQLRETVKYWVDHRQRSRDEAAS